MSFSSMPPEAGEAQEILTFARLCPFLVGGDGDDDDDDRCIEYEVLRDADEDDEDEPEEVGVLLFQ